MFPGKYSALVLCLAFVSLALTSAIPLEAVQRPGLNSWDNNDFAVNMTNLAALTEKSLAIKH